MKCWRKSPPDETGLAGIKCNRDALKCLRDSRHEGRRRKGSVFVYHSWQAGPDSNSLEWQRHLWRVIKAVERERGYAAYNKTPVLYARAVEDLRFLAGFARLIPDPLRSRRGNSVRVVAGVEIRRVVGDLESFQ